MATILDFTAAQDAKKEAMKQADDAARDAWKAMTRWAIIILAYSYPKIVSDDVWKLLQYLIEDPHEKRALGPQMGKAAGEGFIEWTPETVPTAQKSRHNTEIRVWKSLVYGKPPPQHWAQVIHGWQQFLWSQNFK